MEAPLSGEMGTARGQRPRRTREAVAGRLGSDLLRFVAMCNIMVRAMEGIYAG